MSELEGNIHKNAQRNKPLNPLKEDIKVNRESGAASQGCKHQANLNYLKIKVWDEDCKSAHVFVENAVLCCSTKSLSKHI